MKRAPSPRNNTKAEIRIEKREGTEVVVKDYRKRSLPVRLYGRFTLNRESRAYERLAGVGGIPRFMGFEGPEAFAIEHIPSRTLNRIKRGTLPAEVFDKIEALVSIIHSRGVAIVDLHGSNVLLADGGTVYIIDFAHSLVARNPNRPGFLARFFMQLDRHAAARMRARYLMVSEPEPQGFFGAAYRAGRLLKKARRKLRKIKLA